MAYSETQLNGSSDFRVGLDIYLTSQNQSGNYSTFWWGVYLQNPTGSPSWINSPSYWSSVIAGVYREGTFTLSYAERGQVQRLLAAGNDNVGHDGNGFRPGFGNTAGIDTPHSNIGDGSVTVWVDAPRIPKTPLGPDAAPTFSAITPNSMRVEFEGSYDHRGSAVDLWLVRRHTASNPETPGYVDTVVPTSRYYLDVTGLNPSTRYYYKVYSRNGVGYSNGSAVGNAMTLAATKRSAGNAWTNADIFISRNGQWVPATVMISDSGEWITTA